MPFSRGVKLEPRNIGTENPEKLVDILARIYPPEIVSDILDRFDEGDDKNDGRRKSYAE